MKLYVSGFSPDWSDTDLHNLLSQHGKVLSLKIFRDSHGKSRCSGFVWMALSDAERVIAALHASELGRGRRLKVEPARTRVDEREAYAGHR